jgi:hypothetical protein
VNRILAPLLALAALTASAPAQYTSRVLPADYDLAWGRGSSSVLGSNSTRTQMIFAQPFAPGTVVFGIGLRPTYSTVDRPAFTAEVEVRISSTAAVPGALSTTFANNVGSDETVALPRQMVAIPAMRANRGTGAFAQLLFPTPFVFGLNSNPNVNVEVLVYSRSTGASWSTDRGFAVTTGRAVVAGIGCGAATIAATSANGTYVGGATITVTLAGATHSFLVPAGFGQIGLGWQWGHLVPPTAVNPRGVEVTANLMTRLGPEIIVPHAQYVWDLTSASATTGNAATDSVPVVQFLTN